VAGSQLLGGLDPSSIGVDGGKCGVTELRGWDPYKAGKKVLGREPMEDYASRLRSKAASSSSRTTTPAQAGHVLWFRSQASAQWQWKACMQGSLRHRSKLMSSSMHTWHSWGRVGRKVGSTSMAASGRPREGSRDGSSPVSSTK
jgi:hypothetical protein